MKQTLKIGVLKYTLFHKLREHNRLPYLVIPAHSTLNYLPYPRDTVFLVLGPVHPVQAVRESVFGYPLVRVLSSLCSYLGHLYQFPKVYLKPLFAIISPRWPGTISLAIRMYVQSGTCGTIFGTITGRSRKCSIWYLTIFNTERKWTAVNWKTKIITRYGY